MQASVEEGRSPLTHAVSRVDLTIANSGPECDVVLQINVSGEGSRANYNASPFGGMPERDCVYVQASHDMWRRVNGTVSGWVATVRVRAKTEETKVGLSPWYTYADYLSFIASLPSDQHLTKAMIGKSDQGPEHWELTITDPAVPRERKRSIVWHAREHAYESFSSLAMEGLVAWLLSSSKASAEGALRTGCLGDDDPVVTGDIVSVAVECIGLGAFVHYGLYCLEAP